MVLCALCNVAECRYRCPGCLIRYCSLPCFKIHKADACPGSSTVTTVNSNPSPSPDVSHVVSGSTLLPVQEMSPHLKRLLKEIPEEERLPKSVLSQLERSEDLKSSLHNKSLQQMLAKSLDVRNRREAHDHLQMMISQEPAFADFAASCLNIVASNGNVSK